MRHTGKLVPAHRASRRDGAMRTPARGCAAAQGSRLRTFAYGAQIRVVLVLALGVKAGDGEAYVDEVLEHAGLGCGIADYQEHASAGSGLEQTHTGAFAGAFVPARHWCRQLYAYAGASHGRATE